MVVVRRIIQWYGIQDFLGGVQVLSLSHIRCSVFQKSISYYMIALEGREK